MIKKINHIKQAAKVLREGGIVIFPTDTAFGIGCRMDDVSALEKLFSLRRRPAKQAVPVLFDSVKMVEEYTLSITKNVKENLMKKYWPGALTIVLPADLKKVPSLVRGGGLAIGTRVPNHPVPLALIRGVGVPIVGTSANFHGDSTPYKLADVDPKLIYLSGYLVPGVCTLQKESTVVDCTDEPWRVLRKGAVKIKV